MDEIFCAECQFYLQNSGSNGFRIKVLKLDLGFRDGLRFNETNLPLT